MPCTQKATQTYLPAAICPLPEAAVVVRGDSTNLLQDVLQTEVLQAQRTQTVLRRLQTQRLSGALTSGMLKCLLTKLRKHKSC